ncbi:MAG: hypothetical protein HYR76_07935 [Ignavibacteria bacterium]|nr:hypothetical protein [Ignavibacteria bacterium]
MRDSLGFPIDFDHRDTVEFSLTGVPVNGPDSTKAYVSPARAITNASGRVATTVNSGTVSGALQFLATLRRNTDAVIIRSTPVVITVNAGLPDQRHFSIGPDFFNFAAYDWLGRSDKITVLVGDKYTNPVKPQTAVYFNTTGGVIGASGFTSIAGFATVNLYSGNPNPRDSTLSPPSLFGDGTGYAHVASHTLGEGAVEVLDTVLMLFSGRSVVTVPPGYVHIDSGSFATLPVKISDRFGNPLAAGTQITVQAIFSPPQGTNWSVQATGLPTDPLDDYIVRGPNITDYTLRIQDGTPGGTPSRMPFTIRISVTGPNGNAYGEVNGDVGP